VIKENEMEKIWLAVDKDGTETISDDYLVRDGDIWNTISGYSEYLILPEGTIEKILGRKLTWEDEAVIVEGERR
jgi:hypothetical protein